MRLAVASSRAGLQRCAAACLFALSLLVVPPPLEEGLHATPPPTMGMACVASECKSELAACAASAQCAAGLACAGAQASSPTGQVRCMDLFENPEMKRFADCIMTDHQCLPALEGDVDELRSFERTLAAVTASPPANVPAVDRLLTGTWKVALGLNPTFDTFDCQVHTFDAKANRVDAVFRYRVRRPDGTWFARAGGKILHQPDPSKPYHLKLRLNPKYLAYEDDWLILGADDDSDDPWFVVRYHGANAAWKGYGGLNVYTRSGTANKEDGALVDALALAGLSTDDLITVDNSCT